MLAFHMNNGKTLNFTGKPLPPIGHTLYEANPLICVRGLHSSFRPSQAFCYNNGPFLDLVSVSGEGYVQHDKIVTEQRTRLAQVDMTAAILHLAHLGAIARLDDDLEWRPARARRDVVDFIMSFDPLNPPTEFPVDLRDTDYGARFILAVKKNDWQTLCGFVFYLNSWRDQFDQLAKEAFAIAGHQVGW